jgi:hypothetical protein
MTSPRKEYVSFNPEEGYPRGPDLFYECGVCGVLIPSQPEDSTYCRCFNIGVDVGAFRFAVWDESRPVRLVRLKP